tara:strand:- start:381 stop:881 length:501 start_codon:yes stop_codon:yes gene_type:complete
MYYLPTTLSISSATFDSIVYDYNLFNEVPRSRWQHLNINVILKRLILDYSTITKFEFLNLTIYQRRLMYIALYELGISYNKRRIDRNFAVIIIIINNNIRNNIIQSNPFQSNPFQSNLVENNKDQDNNSNNMRQKLIISDIIYDIKDNITDAVFLQLMNTLYKITD